MLSTDELYCEEELKLFDMHFLRRLSYKSIIRNFTVENSLECAKACVRTRKPMKCGAFDTVVGLNDTRNCSLGVEAYSIKELTHEEAEEAGVSHFTYRFYPEVGEDEITYHIGMLISPSTTRNSDQVKFVWNLNLDAPDSNTIVFTVMSVKSWTEDCSKLGKRGMLIVKPAKSRKRKKNRERAAEEPDSINTCLSELTKGDKLRFHSLKAKVVFYTTHLRKYALTLEYEPEYNCTKTIMSPGTLKSPKYPGKYPPSLECRWHYKALPGNVINVQMRDFMVEKVPDCEFDYVQIFDGNTTEATQLTEKRCGFEWTDIITSTSNQILVVFVSDSEVMKTGFNALVTFERSTGSRRRGQRLTAGDTGDSVKDSNFVFYSLWGTAAFAFVVITILGIVCYMLKKRLNAANALVSTFKRNNIVFDSH
ncbi:uncharacterized protein LOC115929588 [Strongylocentrotus purpuratus]|nr:uncharacterized protein LOC115929588 [Strongylocentrotus purpuratus]